MTIGLVITNGTVVTSSGVLQTDIAIDGEKILALGSKSAFPKADRVIDASGKVVIPGGIDTHCHVEPPFGVDIRETWDQASTAAAIGGTTTVIDFAWRREDETILDGVKRVISRAQQLAAVDFCETAALNNVTDLGPVLDNMKDVVDYGVPAFKGYTIHRKMGIYLDEWRLYSVLKRAKELGGMVRIHAENCAIGEEMREDLVKQGKTDPKYHAAAKPNLVENLAIQTCMTLAEATGARTYIVHTSTREGPEIIATYRRKGLPVFCETCPQYLILTDEMFEPKFPRGIYYVCSPPIRKREDIEALWKAVIDGRVNTIGSDHVPHTKKGKEGHCKTFAEIPNGFPGCEVRVPLIYSEGVVKRGLSLQRFVEMVSTNAAKIFGIYPRKGAIAPGSDADIVIIDPNKKHSLNASDLHMGTDLSLYEGMEATGWPVMTILRGKVVVENDKFVGKLGQGQFIKGKIEDSIIRTL